MGKHDHSKMIAQAPREATPFDDSKRPHSARRYGCNRSSKRKRVILNHARGTRIRPWIQFERHDNCICDVPLIRAAISGLAFAITSVNVSCTNGETQY
jgi:hypothetical protein